MSEDELPSGRPQVLLLNGPNLNLLDTRNPAIYGTTPLAQAEAEATALGRRLSIAVTCAQSNWEGELIDRLHSVSDWAGVILNPGGFTHYSYALRDAIEAIAAPVVEVHVSNLFARESDRHVSVTAPVSVAVICGAGTFGYSLALHLLAHRLEVAAHQGGN